MDHQHLEGEAFWRCLRTQELVSEVLNIPSDITFVLIDLAANHFPFIELQLGANALPMAVSPPFYMPHLDQRNSKGTNEMACYIH